MFWAHEAGGEFTYRSGGQDHTIPAAASVHHGLLLEILDNLYLFGEWVEAPKMPLWALEELRDAYCAHQGLPTGDGEADHLVAMLQKFGDDLEVDLRDAGVDLIADFQQRRWRRLLNAIDHLPYASHYRERMLNDPEMARRIAERQAKQDERATRGGIRVSEYTQTVAVIRDVVNGLREVKAAVIASAGGKPGAIEPYPGPITLIKAAENQYRQEQHEALVARVLPGKRTTPGR